MSCSSIIFFAKILVESSFVVKGWILCYFFLGGKKFCTTIDTLTQREPDSMLAAMFSGRHTVCQESDKVYAPITYISSMIFWHILFIRNKILLVRKEITKFSGIYFSFIPISNCWLLKETDSYVYIYTYNIHWFERYITKSLITINSYCCRVMFFLIGMGNIFGIFWIGSGMVLFLLWRILNIQSFYERLNISSFLWAINYSLLMLSPCHYFFTLIMDLHVIFPLIEWMSYLQNFGKLTLGQKSILCCFYACA